MKTMQKITLFAVVAGLAISPAGLNAQDQNAPASGQASAKLDSKDIKFVEHAAQGGMTEVKVGELAAQKGQSSSVKQFGEKLVRDHTKANQELQRIASSKGISVPAELDKKHQKEIDKLSEMSGEEFDKAFIKHAVKDHKEDVKNFEKQAREGEDPAIRSFASETLPVLQEHLRISQTLQENPTASIPELNEPAGAERDSSKEHEQKQQGQEQQPQLNQGAQPQSDQK